MAARRHCPLSLRTDIVLCFIPFVLILSLSEMLMFPRLTTRFCYNSPDPNRITSQCVLCNYFQFDATVLGCTGSSALTVNMTAQQAFCVISQCIGQIRQAPMYLGIGRKKRSVEREISEEELFDQKSSSLSDQYSGPVQSIEVEINGKKELIKVQNEFRAFIVDLNDPLQDINDP